MLKEGETTKAHSRASQLCSARKLVGKLLLCGQRGGRRGGGVRELVGALQRRLLAAHKRREVAQRDLADGRERVLCEERLVPLLVCCACCFFEQSASCCGDVVVMCGNNNKRS